MGGCVERIGERLWGRITREERAGVGCRWKWVWSLEEPIAESIDSHGHVGKEGSLLLRCLYTGVSHRGATADAIDSESASSGV